MRIKKNPALLLKGGGGQLRPSLPEGKGPSSSNGGWEGEKKASTCSKGSKLSSLNFMRRGLTDVEQICSALGRINQKQKGD